MRILTHTPASIYAVTIASLGAISYLRWFTGTLANHRVILQPILLSQGFLPYKNIADQKTPLLPEMLSWLLPLFDGNSLGNARIFHAVLVGATILLVLLWLYRSGGWWGTAIAGVFFLVFMNRFGYWAIAYYDVVLGLLFFTVFVMMARSTPHHGMSGLAWLGVVTGIGILIKQQAGILVPVVLSWIVWSTPSSKRASRTLIRPALTYLLGCSFPVIVYCLYYTQRGGDLRDLYYWTVEFNLLGSYASQGALAPTPSQFLQVLPAFILMPYYLSRIRSTNGSAGLGRNPRLWLLIVFMAALVMLYPRYSGRHWATAFPCLAAITGIGCGDLLSSEARPIKRWFGKASFAVIGVWWVTMLVLIYLPRMRNGAEARFVEYSELVPLAESLQAHLPALDGLAIIPVDEGTANLYTILQQTPPRYYTVFYPWFINAITVKNWLQAVEAEKPDTLLYFRERIDLPGASPEINQYVQEHYQPVDSLPWQGTQVEIMRRIDP